MQSFRSSWGKAQLLRGEGGAKRQRVESPSPGTICLVKLRDSDDAGGESLQPLSSNFNILCRNFITNGDTLINTAFCDNAKALLPPNFDLSLVVNIRSQNMDLNAVQISLRPQSQLLHVEPIDVSKRRVKIALTDTDYAYYKMEVLTLPKTFLEWLRSNSVNDYDSRMMHSQRQHLPAVHESHGQAASSHVPQHALFDPDTGARTYMGRPQQRTQILHWTETLDEGGAGESQLGAGEVKTQVGVEMESSPGPSTTQQLTQIEAMPQSQEESDPTETQIETQRTPALDEESPALDEESGSETQEQS